MSAASSSSLAVHHLDCACLQGLSLRGRPLSCHCLLIETPSSGLVLVDTGFGTGDLLDPAKRYGAMFALFARPKREPALAAAVQIRALGFLPSDVRHIVMTHLDLDHVGGLSDFPAAAVHVHARELKAATERSTFLARERYRPAFWAHAPRFETYSEEGEPWNGFEAVRSLRALPPEILLIPLFGHTLGHCGVAVRHAGGWLLHAGDAYFDPREVNGPVRRCAWGVGIFQAVLQTDRRDRLRNQARLRRLTAEHPEITVFSAHDPFELPVVPQPTAPR